MTRRRPNKAVIRPVDPSDQRSLSHPSHREAWLQLADAIGRLEAREEIRLEKLGHKKNDEDSN